ncbi:ATP-dependent DNA helicase [Rhabdothermincola sediminis]|uniref:ATP-dependent DNA helicase n=1 Tax=Rhabdothermincola sediminis TaxID=2751370 RepID=UPI001AA0286E|nr:ATP-dependent DNA helicase [Rhabdothermincola sediminis]
MTCELKSRERQQALDGFDADQALPHGDVARLAAWAEETATGDRADLAWEPSPRVWAALSVGPRECPGARRCPQGEHCFAERARAAAAAADVVVVNTHLYGLHLASGGGVLPDHEIVVIDEAHQLEDTISATSGLELTAGRFTALARAVRAIVDDEQLVADLDGSGDRLRTALAEHTGRRLRGPLDPELSGALTLARTRVERVIEALRAIDDDRSTDVAARKQRALKAAGSLADDLAGALVVPSSDVAWVEGDERAVTLKVAPIDVGQVLRASLWARTTAVLTSATIPIGLPARIGLDPGTYDELDVGSPFDYEEQALLYCAAGLPDPRSEAFDAATHEELAALIEAAGGRTLALFTSYRAMHAALDALRPRIAHPLLVQDDLPKPLLIERFATDPATCLFATMGFWQGIDVPGPSLNLVTIDRIPFPRPDEPLLQARREQARADAFRIVDLPRATTLLAQGAGRLIRSRRDRGVVAVLDPRLATNQRYRWDIIRALPPMRRTRDRAEAERFLRALDTPADRR